MLCFIALVAIFISCACETCSKSLFTWTFMVVYYWMLCHFYFRNLSGDTIFVSSRTLHHLVTCICLRWWIWSSDGEGKGLICLTSMVPVPTWFSGLMLHISDLSAQPLFSPLFIRFCLWVKLVRVWNYVITILNNDSHHTKSANLLSSKTNFRLLSPTAWFL